MKRAKRHDEMKASRIRLFHGRVRVSSKAYFTPGVHAKPSWFGVLTMTLHYKFKDRTVFPRNFEGVTVGENELHFYTKPCKDHTSAIRQAKAMAKGLGFEPMPERTK